MITKQQSFSFRKPKLTPLYLFSKVRKNNDISHSRQSALSYIEQQQKRINQRYGQIMKRGSVKIEGISDFVYQQEEKQVEKKDRGILNLNTSGTNTSKEGKEQLSKIQQIFKKSPRRSRYNSVQKRTKTDVSPYLSHQRRRLSTQIQNRKNITRQDPTMILKNKIQKQLKIVKSQAQMQLPTKNSKYPQITPDNELQYRHITKKIQNADKIFIHFSNLCKIDSIIQNKRIQKDIIPIIKQYVLEEEGDPSQLENLYESQEICEIVKKILFLEKILVILTVDLIINRKFKLVQIVVKTAIKIMISFYITVYKDLFDAGNIHSEDLIDIQIQALKKVVQAQRSLQKNKNTFSNMLLCLESKIRSCFKFSRHIQNYYKINHRNIHSFTSNLSYFRLLQFYSLSLLGANWLTWNIDFLEVCPSPYLHYEPDKKYTLVLDLDQTLIHYKVNTNNFQGEFLIRPYMFQFLEQMSKYYQIGIFTCSMPEYADLIINHMKRVTFRLYRHHTVRINGEYIKDLSRIGRDLQKMVIIDNLQQNFRLQKMNGIHIRSWYGDRNDDMLKQITQQLEKLAQKDIRDIRNANFRRSFL